MLLAHPQIPTPKKPYQCPQCSYASSARSFVRLHAVLVHQGGDEADVVMDGVSTDEVGTDQANISDVIMNEANISDVDMDEVDITDNMSSADLHEHGDGRPMPVPEIPTESLVAFRTFIPGVGFGTFMPETGLPVQPSSENDHEFLAAPLAQLHINSTPFRCIECLLRPVNGRWCEEHEGRN